MRIGYLIGASLLLAGIFLPRDWYDALPRGGTWDAPPIAGITLFKASLVLEGLVVLLFAWRRWGFRRLAPELRASEVAAVAQPDRIGPRAALWGAGAVTLLALVLRLIGLDSDLWLDEIINVENFAPLPVLQLLGAYLNNNNHLVTTLLAKAGIAAFGEEAWAVRLSPALFGTASIPVLYWLARQLAFDRAASLGAALLLAVSYHHLFFSQNARGYAGYVFFALLASGWFATALQSDRLRAWLLYGAAMFLAFASLLISAWVLAAHGVVGGLGLVAVARRGASPWPLFRRLAAVFGATAFAVFQLYALIIPDIYMRTRTSFKNVGIGFDPFSPDFVTELARGISAGFGLGGGTASLALFGVGLVAAAAVGGTGFVALLRRRPALMLALSLPGLLSAVFLLAGGMSFSPRFFVLSLPVAILTLVQGVLTLADWGAGLLGAPSLPGRPSRLAEWSAAAVVALAVVASALSLGRYYAAPKQPYRASIAYVEALRAPGQGVIVLDLADRGYRYYGKRLGVLEGGDYVFVHDEADLDALLAADGERSYLVVNTLSRLLRMRKPELLARIKRDWEVVRAFPATLGDGEIYVWAPVSRAGSERESPSAASQ